MRDLIKQSIQEADTAQYLVAVFEGKEKDNSAVLVDICLLDEGQNPELETSQFDEYICTVSPHCNGMILTRAMDYLTNNVTTLSQFKDQLDIVVAAVEDYDTEIQREYFGDDDDDVEELNF